LPDEAFAGVEPVLKDALDVLDGSPLRGGGDGAKDFNSGGESVGATRHLAGDAFVGVESVQKDALEVPDGSPLRGPIKSRGGSSRPKGPAKGSLGAMIGQFKSRATKRIWSLPVYDHVPIWQRNYYEHIIRDQEDYENILAYIHTNPLRWAEDQLNPAW
jgi:hypothetical protein